MPATAFPFFNQQFFTDAGIPAAGYVLYQYASGTTTNQATFTDIAGTISNANPIILDSAGRCTMYGGVLAYTFVLKASVGGATVKTWDNVSAAPIVSGAASVLIAGSTMTGPLLLSADPTSTLGAATKQYVDAAGAAATSSVTASVAAATAAAAAANAAVAAIQPSSFFLSNATGSAVSRTFNLGVGTYAVTLYTSAHKGGESGTYSHTVTQNATIGSTTVSTSLLLARAGGSGYGRDIYGSKIATGSLVVSTAGSYTLAMAAISLGGASDGTGSWVQVEKQ